MKILDLTDAIAPDCEVTLNGIRPGEKIHESLVSADEARYTREFDDMFVIEPMFPWWDKERLSGGNSLPDGFVYNSDSNSSWLSSEQLKVMANLIEVG
jgi:UDP-N-acetylglucosamine 4,6-dehydratase